MATIIAKLKKTGGKPLINEKGESIVYIQYSHESKVTLFSTGIKVKPECWNDRKEILDSTKAIKSIKANSDLLRTVEKTDQITNAMINNRKWEINLIVRSLQMNSINPDTLTVKQEYERKNNPQVELEKDFFDLLQDLINKPGDLLNSTIKGYNTLYNNLKKYEESRGKKIKLKDIDYNFYEDVKNYFMYDHELPRAKNSADIIKGMAPNAVGTQIKNLKSFLKKLELKGYKFNVDLSLFKVKKQKLKKIFLTDEELNTLYNHEFENRKLRQVSDLYVLQQELGLRISDFFRLSKDHIKIDKNGNRQIEITTKKALKPVQVPLYERAEEILKKYNYQLPVISEQKFNEYIKEACKAASIDTMIEMVDIKDGEKIFSMVPKYSLISSHSAVKGFISNAKNNQKYSLKEISLLTGKTIEVILNHYWGGEEEMNDTSEHNRIIKA